VSNWGTVREQIIDEARKPNSVQAELDRAMRAMVESIKFNSTSHFYFNESRNEVSLLSGIYNYPLPTDFVELIGRPSFLTAGASGPGKPLDYSSTDEIEAWVGGVEGAGDSSGPKLYSLYDSELLLFPVPTNTGDKIKFRYVKDVGVPSGSFNVTWSFKQPNGSAMTDAYTNEWFTDGKDLTIHRALYYLWTRVYQGEDRAAANAQAALGNWLEEKNRLTRLTTKKKGPPRRLRGHL
jgi:hypothetical protein